MSRPYSNILVPYDGSTYSEKALKMAIEIAGAFDSAIYLVTVIDVSTVSPPGKILSQGTRKTLDQIKDSISASAKSYLQKIQKKYADSGIAIKCFVLEGNTVNKLLKFALDKDVDIVIIGSRGLSGISKITALGSTSRKISELSKCPVIIVR